MKLDFTEGWIRIFVALGGLGWSWLVVIADWVGMAGVDVASSRSLMLEGRTRADTGA